MAALPGTARLFEAEICGRWFFFRHYSVSPLFQAWDGLNYHAGWHFSNHEGGRASLRGLSAIVRGRDALVMLRPRSGGGSFPHHRKGFEEARDRTYEYYYNKDLRFMIYDLRMSECVVINPKS